MRVCVRAYWVTGITLIFAKSHSLFPRQGGKRKYSPAIIMIPPKIEHVLEMDQLMQVIRVYFLPQVSMTLLARDLFPFGKVIL